MRQTEVLVSNALAMNSNSTVMSVADDDIHTTLVELNREFARSLLPTIIYIAIMIAMGLVGNLIAFLVYSKSFKPSSSRTFLLSLSVVSLTACLLCFPAKIAELCLHYTFRSPWACRVVSVLRSAVVICTGSICVAIAADRKRKVCRPSARQWTAREARRPVGVCVLLSVIISSPFAAFSGGRTVSARHANVTGVACGVEGRHEGSAGLALFQAFLKVVFLSGLIVIATSYIQIARRVWKHRKNASSASSSATTAVDRSADRQIPGVEFSPIPGVEFSPIQSLTGEGTSGIGDDTNEGSVTNSNCYVTDRRKCSNNCCWTYTSSDDINVAGRARTESDDKIDASSNDIMNETAQVSGIIDARRSNIMSGTEHVDVMIDTARQEVNDVINNTRGYDVVVDTGCNNMTNTTGNEPGASLAKTSANAHVRPENITHGVHGGSAPLPNSSVVHVSRCPAWYRTVPWIPRRRTSHSYTTSPVGFTFPARAERNVAAKKIRSRTTFTLLVMTSVFVLSHVPTLTVLSLQAAGSYSEDPTAPSAMNFWQLCLLSNYLSFTVSPFVYCLCSVRFRLEFKKMFCSRFLLSGNV